jgi:hypothetical protein
MARIDRVFSRLNLGYRSMLPQWYVDHLWETVDRYENTPHVLWSGWTSAAGFPQHKLNDKMYPLNGYLLYKNDSFQLAGDERIIAACGVKVCQQTSHFRVLPKEPKPK